MAKKEKSGVDKVVKKVNKMIEEVEKLRDREMKRFNDELERRLKDLHEMQQNIMERVGLGSGDGDADKASKKSGSSKGAKTAKSAGTTSAVKSSAKPSQSTASARDSAPAKKRASRPSTPKPVDENDLTRIKGIGPATAEKMRAIGITSIRQIATPDEADSQKLQEFSRMRGFPSWQVEAQKLVS